MLRSRVWNPLNGKPRFEHHPRLNPSHAANMGLYECILGGPAVFYSLHGYAGPSALAGAFLDRASGGLYVSTNSTQATFNRVGSTDIVKFTAHVRITSAVTVSSSINVMAGFRSEEARRFGIANTNAGLASITNSQGNRVTGTSDLRTVKFPCSVVITHWLETSMCGAVFVHGVKEGEVLNYGNYYHPRGFGFIGATGGFACGTTIELVEAWNRILSDAEIAELAQHPYGIASNPRMIVGPKPIWLLAPEPVADLVRQRGRNSRLWTP